MVPELKPDQSEIMRHLRHITRRWSELDQPVSLELVFLSADDRAQVKNVARFSADEIGLDMAAEHAAVMNGHGINAYAVVNPVDGTKQLPPGKRASREDIVASFFQWADADDAQAADNIKSFVGPKCTFHVLTGTQPCARPHVYWELEEPTRNLDAWERTQKAIAATLKTDSSVTDAPRIMRLAGTINWPKPQKRAKGYIAELTTLRIYDEDDRPPVSSERMARAFSAASETSNSISTSARGFDFDTGPQAMDRERVAIQAMQGQEWNTAVLRLVGSYVRKGLSDAEIHALTDPLTLSGYTLEQTRQEVQSMIDRTRSNPKFQDVGSEYTPNFDHAPAPTQSAPDAVADGWKVQSVADFVSDFVAPEYLIDGVVQRGRLYTFTAPTGSGKTAAMLYAATAIATGGQFCGLEVEQGDVLFLAGENPDDVRARIIATLDFYGIDPASCRLHFVAGTFSIRADMKRLREEANKLPNLALVVVDTFAAYFDGEDENSNAQALDFARVVRGMTQANGRPAVIMPAHPVKNASKGNLAPKGGSSLVNEVDGNLTLWNEDGLLTMHWQVKHRGPDFAPLKMELERRECDSVKDRKGRVIPTILAKPVLQLRASQLVQDRLSVEDQILVSIHDAPDLSQRERCRVLGILRADGEADTARISRVVKGLYQQKLIRKFRTKWELTKDGERAVEEISGGKNLPVETDE